MKELYFGDNLDVMKKLLAKNPNGFIDLIYIDPPFNSKRNYNVLFESIDMTDTKAQKEAFSDTWSSVSYHDTLNEIQDLNLDVYKFITVLDSIRISKSAISYLTIMAIRIIYMHKLLNVTGSFYLHCDPTMSHYLKLICDLIFGEINFKNEITWKRTNSIKTSQHKDKKFGVNTDIILFYSKSNNYTFESDRIKVPFTKNEIISRYPYVDSKGRYNKSPLFRSTGMGERKNLCYTYKNVSAPTSAGWKISLDKLIEYDNNGDIDWTNPKNPYRKYRPEHTKGWLISNLWTDIDITSGSERLGYPTQKPLSLLERIVQASSNEGDIVADFFCGCGTTIAAAEKLNRKWLGTDISHLAIKLILKRLTDPYKEEKKKKLAEISVFGFPRDIASAKELANNTDKHRVFFQDWIIEFMIGGVSNTKKSGDGGYDGYITYSKTVDGKTRGLAIIEVKSGNVGVATLRAFMNVVEKEKADIGIFVCFKEQITKGMELEASKVGKDSTQSVKKIQLLSVEDLMNGILPSLPLGGQAQVYDRAEVKLTPNINNQTELSL